MRTSTFWTPERLVHAVPVIELMALANIPLTGHVIVEMGVALSTMTVARVHALTLPVEGDTLPSPSVEASCARERT
jgi:hypothetical protein